jgi:hypothetical protein
MREALLEPGYPQALVFHSLRNTAFGAMMALRAQDGEI